MQQKRINSKDATVKKANAKKSIANVIAQEKPVETTVDARIVQIIPAIVIAITVAIAKA